MRSKRGNLKAAKTKRIEKCHYDKTHIAYQEQRRGLANFQKLQLAKVIEGEPFNSKAEYKKFLAKLIKMGYDYKPIKKYLYEQYKRKYRPMNSKFVNLITAVFF